jgi:hypothetical protein
LRVFVDEGHEPAPPAGLRSVMCAQTNIAVFNVAERLAESVSVRRAAGDKLPFGRWAAQQPNSAWAPSMDIRLGDMLLLAANRDKVDSVSTGISHISHIDLGLGSSHLASVARVACVL